MSRTKEILLSSSNMVVGGEVEEDRLARFALYHELNPYCNEIGFFDDAPFRVVFLTVVFCEDKPEPIYISRLDKREATISVNICFHIDEVSGKPFDVVYGLYRYWGLTAMIELGKKFGLPYRPWEELRQKAPRADIEAVTKEAMENAYEPTRMEYLIWEYENDFLKDQFFIGLARAEIARIEREKAYQVCGKPYRSEKLLLGAYQFARKGVVEHDQPAMRAICMELDPFFDEIGFFEKAPFQRVQVVFAYYKKKAEHAYLYKLHPKEVPPAVFSYIDVYIKDLDRKPFEEVHRVLRDAALTTLIDVGQKYDLPCAKWEELKQTPPPSGLYDRVREEAQMLEAYRRLEAKNAVESAVASDSAAATKETAGPPPLDELLSGVRDKESLLDFIDHLLKDYDRSKDDWEHITVESYLQTIQAWIEENYDAFAKEQKSDTPPAFPPSPGPHPDSAWHLIALLLYMGKDYHGT